MLAYQAGVELKMKSKYNAKLYTFIIFLCILAVGFILYGYQVIAVHQLINGSVSSDAPGPYDSRLTSTLDGTVVQHSDVRWKMSEGGMENPWSTTQNIPNTHDNQSSTVNVIKSAVKTYLHSKHVNTSLKAVHQQKLNLTEDKSAIKSQVLEYLRYRMGQQTRHNMSTSHTMTPLTYPSNVRRQVLSNGLILLGEVHRNATYAVFSCSRPLNGDHSYVFNLPLTVAAWSRIGIKSVIIIVDEESHWRTDKLLSITLKELLSSNDSVLIFMPAETKYAILLSQTGRLFLPMLIPGLSDDVYLLTSDSDLWPLSRSFYHSLINRKRILSTNFLCCGYFQHKGVSYRMLPMCHIGMTVKLWKSVMRLLDNNTLWRADHILDYLKKGFGDEIVEKPLSKGENNYWFMDQLLISGRIGQWSSSRNTSNLLQYVPRHIAEDRLDRSSWVFDNIENKIDSHILLFAYKEEVWPKLRVLLELMYDNTILTQLDNYQATFLSQLHSRQS